MLRPKVKRILFLFVNYKLMKINYLDGITGCLKEVKKDKKKAPAKNCRGLPFNLYSVL